MSRLLSLSLAALALVVFVSGPVPAQQPQPVRPNPAAQPAQPGQVGQPGQIGQPGAAAADNTHEGKFVMAEGNTKFVMSDRNGARHEHALAADAKVTCDGKECKLSDLKEGTMVRVTTERNDQKVATRVDARTKGDFDAGNPNRNRDPNRDK
jgi:hypothetical protein